MAAMDMEIQCDDDHNVLLYHTDDVARWLFRPTLPIVYLRVSYISGIPLVVSCTM